MRYAVVRHYCSFGEKGAVVFGRIKPGALSRGMHRCDAAMGSVSATAGRKV